MLPPSWKAEIEEIVDGAAHSASARQKVEDEKNSEKIAFELNALNSSYLAEQAKSEKGEKVQRAIDVITLLLLFATALFTALAWLVFRDQLNEMKKAYEPLRDSADAAKNSVEVTRAAMKLDQRAWLGVDYIRSDPLIPEIGKPFVVTIQMKNTGKTPARRIVSRGRGEPIVDGRRLNFAYESVEPFTAHLMPGAIASTTVAPMTVPGTNTSVIVNKDILDGLTGGSVKVFVHGKIEYQDIFGEPHWVTYCANLVVPFNGQFGFCPDHNETDGDPESK